MSLLANKRFFRIKNFKCYKYVIEKIVNLHKNNDFCQNFQFKGVLKN